jgi:hypothetical protein
VVDFFLVEGVPEAGVGPKLVVDTALHCMVWRYAMQSYVDGM